MKNVNEKFLAWNEKAMEGDSKYAKITFYEDGMYYVYSGRPYPITKMDVLIDTGDGFRVHFSYDREVSVAAPHKFSMLIRNSRAAILSDEKIGFFAFGLKSGNIDHPVLNAVVFLTTEKFHTLCVADFQSNTFAAKDIIALQEDSKSDAFSVCMQKLCTSKNKEYRSTGGIY